MMRGTVPEARGHVQPRRAVRDDSSHQRSRAWTLPPRSARMTVLTTGVPGGSPDWSGASTAGPGAATGGLGASTGDSGVSTDEPGMWESGMGDVRCRMSDVSEQRRRIFSRPTSHFRHPTFALPPRRPATDADPRRLVGGASAGVQAARESRGAANSRAAELTLIPAISNAVAAVPKTGTRRIPQDRAPRQAPA